MPAARQSRFRGSPGRGLIVALLVLWGAGALPAAVAATEASPTREQVKAAVDKVRADPNMPGTKTEKKLSFKERDDEEDEAEKKSDSLDWLRDFVKAAAEGARWLVWGLGALALAWLAIRLHRWMQVRAGGARPGKALLPSHVGSLDIRPESLPDDIGNAAAALWQRGQHRPALSLLYRGALSRLVHAHEVPVRAASTEGECLAMASHQLDGPVEAFFTRLVSAWQRAIYGSRMPDAEEALGMCRDFDRYLAAPTPIADRGAL